MIFQCELTDSKPFYKLDSGFQMLIRKRIVQSYNNENDRLHYSRSHRDVRPSDDGQLRRMMSTIVKLSPQQSHLQGDDLDSERDA